MASTPSTPSPSRDLDIFGKELGISDGERAVLADAGELFLKKQLHVDSHSKKGEPMEPRTLVLSSTRCYVMSQRPTAKVDVSFSFLKIKQIACSEKKIVFHVGGEGRPRDFHAVKRDVVEIVALITAQLRSVFPVTPLELIVQLSFDSEPLAEEADRLTDDMLASMDRVDASSIAGFMTCYGFICDFFGVPLSKEVSWYLHNVYLAHGFRDLKLADFDHLSTREVLPVLSTLRHNQFFEGLVERDSKMMPELFDELSYVLNTSHSLKKIVLSSCGMRPENLIRLATALKSNRRTALTHLDVSDNLMDDKAIECLGAALEALPHGLQELNLAGCKITSKSGSHLANSMKQNKHMQYSLVSLDLSGNPLGPDPHGALAFLQEPQTIAQLNLSKCNLSFEFVIPVLNRGCQQHLRVLNLSHNAGKSKKGVHGPTTVSALQQFCSSAISIETIFLADCKLPGEAVCGLLEGLAVNPNVASVELNVSVNELSAGRDPAHLPKVLARSKSLRSVDLSDSGLDNLLPELVDAVAGNTAIKHLAIGRNFNGKQAARQSALEKIAALLEKDDCHLESLCLDDSRLKEQASLILNALAMNNSLVKLNIGGNQMGNRGARYLAKALLTNCTLQELQWDHNDTTLYGFQDVANALEHNYTLRVMPLPLFDVARGGRPVEPTVQRIQALLSRNHSDERLKVELAARHRGRLLTTTQQSAVVSRELVQLEDLIKWAESVHDRTHPLVAEALEVKEQANSVVVLTDSLYSPQVESEQFEAVTHQVQRLLDSFIDTVFEEHVKANTERMVAQSNRACSKLLSVSASSTLAELSSAELSTDLTQAKHAVGKKTAPEVINHVSAVNLDMAASISELVVEQTLLRLERSTAQLLKLQKAARSSSSTTPDTRVSRNFTFRVQQEEPVKKRRRRADPGEAEVVLPSSQLDTDGPVLQHPGKARPKPARMQRQKTTGPRKPSVKETVDSDVKEEVAIPQPVTEATDQGEGKESVPEQGEKDKNGPEEGEIKKSGPDQGEIKKKGPAEGKIDKNGPDQGEIKKKGLEEGKIDKNGPDQEEIKKKGPEEGEIDKNGTEEGEIKKNGPDQGEIKKKGPEEGEIKKKGPEEGKIMKKEPEEGEIMQTPVSLAEEGEMKEAVLGEVEMKEEPRAVEEISVGPADATVLLQEEPSQVEPAEQIQAVDERDKSVEVEATASLPMADVIEVGLADEEPLALREEGLEAGGTTTEPPPAAMEGAVESVSPVLPPAEVEAHKERDSPAASPKPLPKPRVTKPLAEAEHKELVQSVPSSGNGAVQAPDITVESGSPAKGAAGPADRQEPAGDSKKKKSKKDKSNESRPLTPSSESEGKGERRPSKDRRRSGFTKLFGRPKKEEEQRISAEWEVLGAAEAVPPTEPGAEAKPGPDVSPKPRPPVKEKPRRAHSLDIDELTLETEKRVGGVVTANMSELADVLKRGRGTQLRPARPQETEATASSCEEAAQAVKRSPGGPPKPKPKPRPTKRAAAAAAAAAEDEENRMVDVQTGGADGTLV